MRKFKNILFVNDPGEEGAKSFARAVELAEDNGAELTVIEVLEKMPAAKINAERRADLDTLTDKIMRERLAHLERQVEPIRKKGKIRVSAKVVTGRLFLAVIRQVLRDGHDLVIKSARAPKGIKAVLFGGTDMHLLRKCPCPVWLVKHGENARYDRIMAALDVHALDGDEKVDELNRQILEIAASLAMMEASELHLAHAWYFFAEEYMWSGPAPFSERDIEEWLAEEQQISGLKLEQLAATVPEIIEIRETEPERLHIHLEKGDPKEIIPQLAHDRQIDLVVMGTVSRGGIAGFFIGNTAESILHHLDCSVLAVKPPGFVSPVTLEE